MPLPAYFDSATLVVNGRSYSLTAVSVTDHSFEQEFGDVRGARGVVARTAGRATERVTFEAEVSDETALPRGGTFTIRAGSAIGATGATGPNQEPSRELESDESLRERIIATMRPTHSGLISTGALLDAVAATYGIQESAKAFNNR